jgi:hypothetical protein
MLTSAQIQTIARAMVSGQSIIANRIDAGYTYLGQFIAHEIVSPTHPLPGERTETSPYLDLDSLYGTADRMPSFLDRHGKFPIGPNFPGGPDDLPRSHGVARIPDARSDDNVILSQLQLLLQRLHNFVIDQKFARDPLDARRQVTLLFQLLVVEDYLRQILAPVVFDSYFRFDKRWLNFEATRIPLEFSRAVFRFGHTMTRPFYEGFAKTPDARLEQLFHPGVNLDPALVLEWPQFFGWPEPDDPTQDAARLDPFVVAAMGSIPRGGGTKDTVDIVLMNLRSGEEARLPAGREYVTRILQGPQGGAIRAALSLDRVPTLGDFAADELAAAGVSIDNLPLWPYVLVEAMHSSKGQHLGVLGSMICAEVLANSIAHARHSIYQGGWPAVDDVLASMGGLGERLQAERRNSARPRFNDRTFCVRHVVEMVLNG